MASLSVSRLVAGASTNATLVKAGPGTVNGWSFQNAAAYAVYFKLYNSATIPTAGAGTPVLTIAGETITDSYHNLSHHGHDPEKIAQLKVIELEQDALVLV
jgi:hypothetical protein